MAEARRSPNHHYEHRANILIWQFRRVVNISPNKPGVVTVLVSERCPSHGRVWMKMRPRLLEHPGLSDNTAVVLSCARVGPANPLSVAPWSLENSC